MTMAAAVILKKKRTNVNELNVNEKKRGKVNEERKKAGRDSWFLLRILSCVHDMHEHMFTSVNIP